MVKVLFIDDEHEYLENTYDIGKDYGVSFVDRCKSLEKAKEHLKTPDKYDAIISDANFLENEDDIENGLAPKEGAGCLVKLNKHLVVNKIDLKIFVYSGRVMSPDFKASLENITTTFGLTYNKKRLRGPQSTTQLFEDIIDHCNNLESFKLINEHREVFDLFDQDLSDTAKKVLVEILLAKNTEVKGYINLLRTLLDGVLKKLIKNEHLPSGFLHGELVNFKKCERFINEEVVGEIKITNPFGQRVKTPFNAILQPILHPGSHSEDFLTKNRYLVKGTAFFLMDLLLNLSPYIKTKAKTKNWKEVDIETGALKFYNPDREYGIIENTKYPKGGIWFSKKSCSFGDDEFEKLTEGTLLSYTPHFNKKRDTYNAIGVSFFEEDDPDQEYNHDHN